MVLRSSSANAIVYVLMMRTGFRLDGSNQGAKENRDGLARTSYRDMGGGTVDA